MMQIYKGYTIQEDFRNPYSNKPEFMFYPTEEGVQHDGDYDDGWKYCGNCKWASTVEDAKDEIDELTCEHEGDEIIKQGNGFVYKLCADCGNDI